MIPLLHDGICTIFLHSWLQINGFSLDRLELKKLGKKYNLANPIIISNLEYSYIEYLQSGKSLDDFFDRQIIICRGYNKKLFKHHLKICTNIKHKAHMFALVPTIKLKEKNRRDFFAPLKNLMELKNMFLKS